MIEIGQCKEYGFNGGQVSGESIWNKVGGRGLRFESF
jgi:hypothetical protein